MPDRERNHEHGGAYTIGAAVLTLSLLPSRRLISCWSRRRDERRER